MKFLNISEDEYLVQKMIDAYLNEHSKCVHGSYLVLNDLGESFSIKKEKYVIIGLWNITGKTRNILVRNLQTQKYYFEDSKIIAEALGYNNLRNLVTNTEIDWNLTDDYKYRNDKKTKYLLIDHESATNMYIDIASSRHDAYLEEDEVEETVEETE
jgi:hypothetical protein